MPSSAPVGPLIYSLYDHPVAEGDIILTDVTPFATDMTILFDMTITANPTNTSSSAYRYILIEVGSASNGLNVWKSSQWSNVINAVWFGKGNGYGSDDATIGKSAAGRKRIVITRAANAQGISGALRAIGKMNDSAPVEKTITSSNAINVSEILQFGDSATGRHLPPGTITKIEVYNTILSDDEINAFLA